MMDFKDKVAVITGGGAGIGRAMAIQLASEGCHLALADISEEGLNESVKLLSPYGVKVSTHIVDVTSRERMESFPAEVIEAHGKVNLLANNAGITLQKTFEGHSIEDWEFALGINLWGVIYGSKAFLPYLKESAKDGRGNAHIINMSSLAAFMGMPNTASYSATKAAVRTISESMWAELHSDNIGVTSVHPGAIRTNIMRAHIENSSNLKVAKETADKVEKFAMAPEKCVNKILKAVKKDKQRVVIGVDAKAVELLKRFLPSAIHKPFAKQFAKEKG
jgi:short-subunit dehydrogenase